MCTNMGGCPRLRLPRTRNPPVISLHIAERLPVTPSEALIFVATHGVALEAGTGPVASLAEVVVGAPIQGSWWAHPRGRQIFAVTRAIRDCPDVLVCRLIGGKITYVHRRLWPALVRVANRFPVAALAQIHEVHAPSGKHVTKQTPFPEWVPQPVAAQARKLGEKRATSLLGAWSEEVKPAAKRRAPNGKPIASSNIAGKSAR
jgi:hypothetical protein